MKRLAIHGILLLSLLNLIACNSGSNQPTVQQTTPTSQPPKRYQLKGKIVSVDKRAHMVNVDSEDIPGFMSAMTMPYNVKPESELDKLSPGESITADLVVDGDNSWLENISVIGRSSGTAPNK